MWFTIYKREIKAYFQTPTLYILASVFFFLMAYFTLSMMIEFSDVYNDYSLRGMYGMKEMNVTEWAVRGFFSLIQFMMLFFIPLFSMRLFAEEQKNGTLEVLLTNPIGEGAIFAGKFLAGLTVLTAMLAGLMIYPVLFEKYSQPEWPVIWTGWLGVLLLVLAGFSFGVFCSALTENQIIASFLCFSGLLFFYLVGDVTSSQEGLLGRISMELSLQKHGEAFSKGVIEARDVFYFLAFSLFFIYATLEILKIRRWRS